MSEIIKYVHHGTKEVSVQEHLKGKHREHCLCWQNCKHFTPENRDENCNIANELFGLCVDENIVALVWECPRYGKN